jgi:hypothetical protein
MGKLRDIVCSAHLAKEVIIIKKVLTALPVKQIKIVLLVVIKIVAVVSVV